MTALLAGCIAAPPPLPDAPGDTQPETYRPSALDGAQTYRVDSGESQVVAYVYRAGTLAAKGHNHVIAAREIGGRVAIEDQVAAADLFVRLLDLTVDEPALRAAAGEGFESELSAKDVDGTRRNMLGPKTLAAGEHPYARVVFGDVPAVPGAFTTNVEVTLRGETRTVPAAGEISLQGAAILIEAELTVQQSAYGIEPFSILGGAIRVEDEVPIAVRLRLISDAKMNDEETSP